MFTKRVLLFVLVTSALLLVVGGVTPLLGTGVAQMSYTFQGRVYAREIGDESRPLPGVTVSLYGANNPYPDPGNFIASTTTNGQGWYGLEAPDGYENGTRLRQDSDLPSQSRSFLSGSGSSRRHRPSVGTKQCLPGSSVFLGDFPLTGGGTRPGVRDQHQGDKPGSKAWQRVSPLSDTIGQVASSR